MATTFSLVYPTRHRPEYVREALRILEIQGHDGFEVVVCDNYVDPALSCEDICRESRVPNLRYVRPPRPVGMVENWSHALPYASGDYVAFLTDKMFVLPGALGRVEQAVAAAGNPDIVSWTSDGYNPARFRDSLGDGVYVEVTPPFRDPFRAYDPARELDRRGEAAVSRHELSSADYGRGKLAFGAYARTLIERIIEHHGALFHTINPDYTSMVLGLSRAGSAIELASSCVVSVNTDISNGWQTDVNDAAMLAFYESLAGGAAAILPKLLVPGVYASQHNGVAHDYLAMKRAYDLPFRFDEVNWLTYVWEDVHRPGRRWSDAGVEADQKGLLRAHLDALGPAVAAAVDARVAARAARSSGRRGRRGRRALGRLARIGRSPRGPEPTVAPSILVAVQQATAGGR
jgi:hypothetical protein